MNPAEIRALAFVVNHVRPSWPVKDIERALVDDPRGFTDVALAAVTAAASPDTRFPGGIKPPMPVRMAAKMRGTKHPR